MSPVCPQAEFVLPGARWLLLPSFPCVCYGSITAREGNNGNETRVKGESAVLYSEGGDTAMLSWKREASHLPAEGEDSDTLTSAKCLARVAGLTCHQPLALGLLLFLWPKVCRIGLAAPTDHISAAEWPEFSSSLLKLTSWLLMRPINGQLELSPDKCPKAHCLAGCGGVTRTYQLSD